MDFVALEEIRQLKYRYLRSVDEKRWDELADTLTPDATADYGTPTYGKPLRLAGWDEIVGFMRKNLGPTSSPRTWPAGRRSPSRATPPPGPGPSRTP
jgi:hypothetical protein